jgi:glucose/arabinose dehydrogenase
LHLYNYEKGKPMKSYLQNKSTRQLAGFVCLFLITAVLINALSAVVRTNQPVVVAGSGGSLNLSLAIFASGLSSPVGLANAGDGRMFAIERTGRVRVIQANGTVLPTPFLDIISRVDSSSSEEGLLGIAFHPDYVTNGYFYLNYINTSSGTRRTRISRFSVTANPDIADPNSEQILLTVTQPDWNHNAGKINFGPDGYLYIPLGDGGGGGDSSNNAQNLGLLLGKVSRIDVDSGPGSAPDCEGVGTGSYTIPNSNPLIDGSGGTCDEIWAIGLRNPWQSTFDRQTGDLYIGDVGQNAWEEIDYQPASSTGGENYGWRCYEGNAPYNTSGCLPQGNYEFPIFVYANSPCYSVSGGYVYRGSMYPEMVGHYILADACTGRFWDLDTDNNWSPTLHTNMQAGGYVSFGEDINGEIYVVNIGGTIYHLEEDTTGPTPTPTTTATATVTATPSVAITPTAYQYRPVVEHDM